MAPPAASAPPTTVTGRLAALARTLQFAWFVGHASLLACFALYSLSYVRMLWYSWWATMNYRACFLAAALTYGIVVFKAYRARLRMGKKLSVVMVAGDENVQYLVMALIWLSTRQMPLAILPYVVYSVFHVATYARSTVIPMVTSPAPSGSSGSGGTKAQGGSALGDTIGRFVKRNYDTSMALVAALEIALWFRVLVAFVLLQRGAWLVLLAYSAFLRARYAQSKFVQEAFARFAARVDALTANQSAPPQLRAAWGSVRAGANRLLRLTDFSALSGRSSGAPASTPRKTQ